MNNISRFTKTVTLAFCTVALHAMMSDKENKETIQWMTLNINNKDYATTVYMHPQYKLYTVEKSGEYEALLCGKFIINNKEYYSSLVRKNHLQSAPIPHSKKIFELLEIAAKRKFLTTEINL